MSKLLGALLLLIATALGAIIGLVIKVIDYILFIMVLFCAIYFVMWLMGYDLIAILKNLIY